MDWEPGALQGCCRPVSSLHPGTPAAPFLSIRLPLPPPPTLLTSHFTPSPSSCSPRPHLCRVKHPTNFSGPGSLIGEVGVGWPGCRLPFAWPCFCSPVTLAQPSHPIFHCSGKPGCTARSQQSLAPSPPPTKGAAQAGYPAGRGAVGRAATEGLDPAAFLQEHQEGMTSDPETQKFSGLAFGSL